MSEEDAASRKRRLQEMRNKAMGNTSQPSTESTVEPVPVIAGEEPFAKKPKFRNYQPFDKRLASNETTLTNTEKSNEENVKTKGKSIQETEDLQPVVKKKTLLEEELENTQNEEINLVPKKVNADLKQQVAGKLEKLKRRTQKAIVEILREKLSIEAIDE